MKKIIISGSLAYDRIMDFPEYFSDHILPDKIHILNVSFQVNGVTENFGGTAGNIAHAFKLMGEEPYISATIGQDNHRYFDWLKNNGISTDYIKKINSELTAGAYITTDKADNQITGFNPGAMKYSSELDFHELTAEETLLIVSPGNLDDMSDYPRMCKERGIEYIFDPGQALPMLKPQDLIHAIEGCKLLIVNDYEFDMVLKKTELSKATILEMAGTTIITLGEHGSQVYTPNGETVIPPSTAKEVVDPTGAGDAYRGGLLSGLVKGQNIEEAARIGSVCASFAVECYGTQEYSFTTEEFRERMENCT